MATPRTSAAFAVVASLLIPGAGQLYAGRPLRGAGAFLGYHFLTYSVMFLQIPLLYFAVVYGLRGLIVYDAYRCAEAKAETERSLPEPAGPAPLPTRALWTLMRLPWSSLAPGAFAWFVADAALDSLGRGRRGDAALTGLIAAFAAILALWALCGTWRVASGREIREASWLSGESQLAAIIYLVAGILFAMIFPSFKSLMRVSAEGAAKGNLGALRASALSYRNAHGGAPPPGPEALFPAAHLTESPALKWNSMGRYHPESADFSVLAASAPADSGKWAFVVDPSSPPLSGAVFIDCTHTDNRGRQWHQY
jgi:TM2 domain-containing membrane protein YozV